MKELRIPLSEEEYYKLRRAKDDCKLTWKKAITFRVKLIYVFDVIKMNKKIWKEHTTVTTAIISLHH